MLLKEVEAGGNVSLEFATKEKASPCQIFIWMCICILGFEEMQVKGNFYVGVEFLEVVVRGARDLSLPHCCLLKVESQFQPEYFQLYLSNTFQKSKSETSEQG